MDDFPKVDLQKNRMPKMSWKYWLKVILYTLLLGAFIFWLKNRSQTEVRKVQDSEKINEIRNVEIEI